VPQSFLPALVTPARFSVSPFAANAVFATPARPIAISEAMLPCRRGWMGLMSDLQWVEGASLDRSPQCAQRPFLEKNCRAWGSRHRQRKLTFRSRSPRSSRSEWATSSSRKCRGHDFSLDRVHVFWTDAADFASGGEWPNRCVSLTPRGGIGEMCDGLGDRMKVDPILWRLMALRPRNAG